MRVKRWGATIVAIAVLALAACGSGSTSGSSTTTTRRSLTHDRDLAQRALVTSADLPADWLPAASADAGPMALMDSDNLEPVATCLHVPATRLEPAGAVTQTSSVFQAPDKSTVQSRVMLLAKPTQATAALATLGTKAFARCVQQRLEAGIKEPLPHPVLAPDLSVSKIVAAPLVWPKYGDGSRAMRVRTSLVGADQGLDLYLQLVFIARGRSLATMAFTSTRDPFPLDRAEDLSLFVANRLPA